MKLNFKRIWFFIRDVFEKWSDDKAPKLGAAMSYYTVFSLAPLLIISISVAGLLFGQDAAQGRIVTEIQGLVGKEGATFIETAIKNSRDVETGIIAGVVSLITLFIGATAAFIELQDSLNMIWKVKPIPSKNFVKDFIKTRIISFALVVGIGFLLLVSLIISAGLSALNDYVTEKFLSMPVIVLHILNFVLSFGIIFIMFSMIYKILPDVEIRWKDVWIGATVTASLFVLGKFGIGLYLGSSSYSSTYGAAGSLVILLVWVYYSAQILFLGAEFTQVYANHFGSGIRPSRHAKRLDNCDDDEMTFQKK